MYRSTRPLAAQRPTRAFPAYWSTRPIPWFVAPVLIAVAILGYLAGHHRATRAAEEPVRVAYEATIALEYPSTWHRTGAAASIPGLQIVSPLLLAPGGDSARAGLVSGELAPTGASPLPAALVSLLQGLPRTEVVEFLGVQAYRYSGVRLARYNRALDLYVLPNSSGPATALACYAAPQHAADLTQCESIVSRLTPVGRSPYDLKPDAAYSARLGGVIGALDSLRLRLRHQMSAKKAPATVARLASTLVRHLATAAASIRALQAPASAAQAQAALVVAIERAGQTYRALGAAAAAPSVAAVAEAQSQVDSAEAGVDVSLETFALLGYKHS
jgi:hypothetical protein